MAGVARGGDGLTTGHGCTPMTTIDGGLATGQSAQVFVNGMPIACLGDMTVVHTIGSPPKCVPHIGAVGAGSGTVFAGGKAVARIGDSADAGAIIAGSGNVMAGG